MVADVKMKTDMDDMYRWTRHVYDASRKYYLLGRDKLIENLRPYPSQSVIEIGCGTARNVIRMATLYPESRFYGLDVSEEMLKTARRTIDSAGLSGQVALAQGDAQSFAPEKVFELTTPPDMLVYSYSLSIIPPWRESLDHGLTILKPGGAIHIVDFGGMEKMPGWVRRLIFTWLRLFHVYHKPEILDYLRALETQGKGHLKVEHLYGGYAYYAQFVKAQNAI